MDIRQQIHTDCTNYFKNLLSQNPSNDTILFACAITTARFISLISGFTGKTTHEVAKDMFDVVEECVNTMPTSKT